MNAYLFTFWYLYNLFFKTAKLCSNLFFIFKFLYNLRHDINENVECRLGAEFLFNFVPSSLESVVNYPENLCYFTS